MHIYTYTCGSRKSMHTYTPFLCFGLQIPAKPSPRLISVELRGLGFTWCSGKSFLLPTGRPITNLYRRIRFVSAAVQGIGLKLQGGEDF